MGKAQSAFQQANSCMKYCIYLVFWADMHPNVQRAQVVEKLIHIQECLVFDSGLLTFDFHQHGDNGCNFSLHTEEITFTVNSVNMIKVFY